ncbi:MAG: hypothetical protein JSW15_07830 [Deltaproteobacteria bacterium]|jgi:hypothetical protein|nr:MAG: hypothetical protein JSW15_07830 [Deltaproteobacteria bacterium]
MATAKQIQYRLGQAKRKLTKVNKELAATKSNIKKLEAQLKRAKAAERKKPKKKKAAPRRKRPVAKKKKRAAAKKKRRR